MKLSTTTSVLECHSWIPSVLGTVITCAYVLCFNICLVCFRGSRIAAACILARCEEERRVGDVVALSASWHSLCIDAGIKRLRAASSLNALWHGVKIASPKNSFASTTSLLSMSVLPQKHQPRDQALIIPQRTLNTQTPEMLQRQAVGWACKVYLDMKLKMPPWRRPLLMTRNRYKLYTRTFFVTLSVLLRSMPMGVFEGNAAHYSGT